MASLRLRRRPSVPSEIAALLAGVGALACLTALYSAWLGVASSTTVALSFLLIVLIVAAMSTRWVAVATSLAAFLCFNYFFLPPVGTWFIAEPQNWVALFTLLAVSIVASHLSAQVRQRAQEAMARRDELARLFQLTRDILLTTDASDALALVARSIERNFGLSGVTICLPGEGGWVLHSSGQRPLHLEPGILDAAMTGAPVPPLVSLRLGPRTIGLLALEGDAEIEPGTRDAIAGVTSIAVERTQLLEERKETEVLRRGAELKSALLASLSHDLKTPLTAVTVAANNLDAVWLTAEQRAEQAEIVRAELMRLNRLFQDIVDMARIEAQAVAAEPEWVPPEEIVEAAVHQVEHAIAGHRLEVESGAESTLVHVDPKLTSAALAHLLENAGQYSPSGSTITVTTTLSAHELHLSVRDRGIGIAPQDVGRVFERFYRGMEARHQRFGTGMGLAITRGLLAAEGGRVWASNHGDGGAVFTIAVPAKARIADLEGETA